MIDTVLYLHGLASSPKSNKAQLFRQPFNSKGVRFEVPDLNVPDFEHLTLTAMLARVAETIAGLGLPAGQRSVALIGSSMGGLTALHFIDRYRQAEAAHVARLVLMAPALDFMANRRRSLGDDGLAKWQATGWLPTFHYAEGGERRLHYGLVEDVRQYDSESVSLDDMPTLIFHGTRDESVDYRGSVRFAETHPTVTLRLLESDHQLLDQTDTIWREMAAFLEL